MAAHIVGWRGKRKRRAQNRPSPSRPPTSFRSCKRRLRRAREAPLHRTSVLPTKAAWLVSQQRSLRAFNVKRTSYSESPFCILSRFNFGSRSQPGPCSSETLRATRSRHEGGSIEQQVPGNLLPLRHHVVSAPQILDDALPAVAGAPAASSGVNPASQLLIRSHQSPLTARWILTTRLPFHGFKCAQEMLGDIQSVLPTGQLEQEESVFFQLVESTCHRSLQSQVVDDTASSRWKVKGRLGTPQGSRRE